MDALASTRESSALTGVARKREPEIAVIDSMTHDGRGIATVAGKKVFVPGALPGEQVRMVRRKIRRGHDEADLLNIVQPSAERMEPRCAVFGVCGGCALQHVDATSQRVMKQQSLADTLARIGGIAPARWLDPLFDEAHDASWRYRRRARLAVRDVSAKGRVLVGFRERRARIVTDMHRCEVLASPLSELIDPLSELIGQLSIRARLPQIELAAGDNAVELVFRVLASPTADDRALLRDFAQRFAVSVSLQPGAIESVEPLSPDVFSEPLYYDLPEFGVRIFFEPTDFVQVNARVNRRLVTAAVDLLQLREEDRVLDLFCGIGNFSLPIARRAGYVLGLEGELPLVARAVRNAAANELDNAEFSCCDLSKVHGNETWIRRPWTKVLLDPPRSGAEVVMRKMAKIGAERVVCVSCHPATLARDAGILSRTQGYRLEAAGIIDMFPHTAHVEAIAVFVR